MNALLIIGALLAVLGAALFAGGPVTPQALASINDPFRSVDFTALPEISTFAADDGNALAYRSYKPTGTPLGSVTLVHGSSASSESMHPLATSLVKAGYEVFALDMRGHGHSGSKGHIAYIGQLEEDLAAFVRRVKPLQPSTLLGFSAGAGFVLRFAGGANQSLFSSCLLLSPFITQDAPNYRSDSSKWVHVGLPRTIAISMLDSMGIHAFNQLPIIRFALNEEARSQLTPEYDFNLAMNFRASTNFKNNIRNVNLPCTVIAGADDELFDTSALKPLFNSQGKSWSTVILPNIGHIGLTLDSSAHSAIEQEVRKLHSQKNRAYALPNGTQQP